MSALPARPNFSNRPRFNCGSCSIDSVSRSHGEVVEVHVAVGLRPQPDAARDRLGQDMLEVQLAVEIGRDLGPAIWTLRSCHWRLGVGVLRIHFTEDRLPFSNFHSTRLFSRGFARTVK